MRRALVVFALALALPALVHAASNPIVAAVERTASATSATFRMSMTTAVADRTIRLTGSGAQSRGNARISVRSSGPLSIRIDAVVIKEGGAYVMYLRSPLFGMQLPQGKTWLRVRLSKQASKLGADLSSMLGASASQSFAPLEKGLISTTRLGPERVAGLSTTRYRAVLDVQRAARAVPVYGQQIAALQRASGVKLRQLRYDVWVAGDGRIHQLRYSTPLATAGVRGRVAQTMTFLSFDKPVRIVAPPRSQVFTP